MNCPYRRTLGQYSIVPDESQRKTHKTRRVFIAIVLKTLRTGSEFE
jgi:hypothetical protein